MPCHSGVPVHSSAASFGGQGMSRAWDCGARAGTRLGPCDSFLWSGDATLNRITAQGVGRVG
eukprot:5718027-Alexandrium_andersonii.AAC.1